MFPYEEYIDGLAVSKFMRENADICAYLAFGYLGMVRYGPGIAKKLLGENPPPTVDAKGRKKPAPDPAWLRTCMILWNILLSVFSWCGMFVMVPPLIAMIREHGIIDTISKPRDELVYTTPCGSWTGIFLLSKIPELIDTFWLIVQKKKTPPFLHWYHHVSVLIFGWMSYALGNSTMCVFASMNISVHAVMYGYFAICALGFKKIVRPFAPFITGIQILQMVGGSIITFYSYVVNFSSYQQGIDDINKLPCAVNKSTARFGSIMYLSYLYLFSELFVKSYIKKPSKEAAPVEAKSRAAPAPAAAAASKPSPARAAPKPAVDDRDEL